MDRVKGIVERLEGISEELADESIETLRAAHAAGETRRPERERVISQARRSVEKAAALLRRIEEPTG